MRPRLTMGLPFSLAHADATPNPSATQYLSESIFHTEVVFRVKEMVFRVDVRYMWFRTKGEPPPPHEKKCVCPRKRASS